jgi:anti-sigma factor RsiW
MGHVGAKVSALIDGQLSRAESERLWTHVHQCELCRAQVEREGWVKTQLAALSCAQPSAPHELKGALSGVAAWSTAPATSAALGAERRRMMTFAAIGAGSIGAAMVGVIALSVPAETPGVDRRGPASSITQSSESPTPAVRGSGAPARLARLGVSLASANLASGRVQP